VRFDVVTIFPEMFASFLATGLIGKAHTAGLVSTRFANPRDFTTDKHRSVDDTPYGGGSGMVMRPGPIVDALEHLDASRGEGAPRARRVLLTPRGALFRQADAIRLSGLGAVALVCGRYEGIDERVRAFVDEELSIGDFVVTGGEVAAMAIIEATARLLPRVLGNAESIEVESHAQGLLEHPQYTRPASFRGLDVPEVLLSGDHAKIARWREAEAIKKTREVRPELLKRTADAGTARGGRGGGDGDGDGDGDEDE